MNEKSWGWGISKLYFPKPLLEFLNKLIHGYVFRKNKNITTTANMYGAASEYFIP